MGDDENVRTLASGSGDEKLVTGIAEAHFLHIDGYTEFGLKILPQFLQQAGALGIGPDNQCIALCDNCRGHHDDQHNRY